MEKILEPSRSLCSQIMLRAASLSCSPLILIGNFDLLFLLGGFWVGLPHPKAPFLWASQCVGTGARPFPAGSSSAPGMKSKTQSGTTAQVGFDGGIGKSAGERDRCGKSPPLSPAPRDASPSGVREGGGEEWARGERLSKRSELE